MKVNGRAIKAAREAILIDGRKMSQERLAHRAGVSSATIERLEQERGGDQVAATTIYAIAKALDVDLESLFTEESVA
jgi:transcriptional regulator with XRE-family HTH domain